MRDLRDIDRCILAKPGKTRSLRAMAVKLPDERALCEKQMRKLGAKKNGGANAPPADPHGCKFSV
jgi:hypothetical protein